MVKRPLIWILCAYLAGMYLGWQELPVSAVIPIMVLLGLLVYFLMYKVKNPWISNRDKFLWCLPLLIVLGFGALKGQIVEPELSKVFDQQIDCKLTGNINMIVKKQWGRALYLKDNTVTLSGGENYLSENIIVFCYEDQKNNNKKDISLSSDYLIGNQITVQGTLLKFSIPGNPGQFNEKLYYQIENIDFKMEADSIVITDEGYSVFRQTLRQLKDRLLTVYQSILRQKEAGTVIAMLLGDKYLLDNEIKQLYQINGISHILAISGLHVSLIGMFLFWLLKKLRIPHIPATFLTIFFIYCYGVLTDFSVSTNRAVVMMTLMLLSGIIGKTYDMLSSLALGALLILLQNPLQIMSAGFLLSFGAVLGIAILYPCLQKLLPTKNPVLCSLYVSLSAQIATTPIIAYFFYQLPTYSVLTNLIILPFVTVLTLSSIAAGITGSICEPLGVFLIGGSNYILKFYEWVCRIGSMLPNSMITTGKPDMVRLLFYVLFLVVFCLGVQKFEKKALVFLPAAALFILLLPVKNTGLEITMLDIGQGDAILLESKSGTTYLIDGGSTDVKLAGKNRIQPFLLSRGTDTLDYVIITHSDEDHINGLLELMETKKIKIHTLVLPEIGNRDEAYLKLEDTAKQEKIKVSYISTGDTISDGKLKIFCLHPVAGYKTPSSNSYSTVLSITYGDFDMLFTGDLQKDQEEEIVRLLTDRSIWKQYNLSDTYEIEPATVYDILKVAHHGSKYSSLPEFLDLIKPSLSLISCGKGNSFGHPHHELLQRLKDVNSKTMITYETGAITIKTDGKRMKVSQFRED